VKQDGLSGTLTPVPKGNRRSRRVTACGNDCGGEPLVQSAQDRVQSELGIGTATVPPKLRPDDGLHLAGRYFVDDDIKERRCRLRVGLHGHGSGQVEAKRGRSSTPLETGARTMAVAARITAVKRGT